MKISVIGLGKAGLPLAAVIADAGIKVIGVDIDGKKTDMINHGINPIPEEAGLSALVKKHGGKNLSATCDSISAAKQSTAHIVIVPLFIDPKESPEKAFEVYSKFAKPVKVSNCRTAELAKVAEGVYRDVNIAMANELLKVSEHYNVDFWEMKDAARHQYCNILEPGNVGGHCIPVYPWFLINEMKVPLIKTARTINDGMINYYAEKVGKIGGKKVGVLGLSYREGVKEKAYSRSIDFISLLKKKGYDVYALDPLYSKEETEKEFNVKFLEDLSKMDVIVLMNRESVYKEILSKIKSKVVDVKNLLGEK